MKRARTGSGEDVVVSDNEAVASARSGSDLEEWNNLAFVRTELEQLLGLHGTDLKALVNEIDVWLKQKGWPILVSHEERDTTAYFHCSCRRPNCFKVTFSRPSAQGKDARRHVNGLLNQLASMSWNVN
jgi:hypothetical protein